MILVTGASGFLGLHLLRCLSEQGASVKAIYHNNLPQQADAALPGVVWEQADLLDIFDVERIFDGVTHVYHCAAIVSFDAAMHEAMLHFNTESTANVVNQCIVSGVTKLLHVSSIAAIGRTGEPSKVITEEEQWGETQYKTGYGFSKYLAETEVWRGIGEGLNAVIINPGIILGEGNWQTGSPELMTIAWKQFSFYTKGVTCWVDVRDVAQVAILLMNSEISGERYIVAENNYSYQHILGLMATALNRRGASIYANKWLTGLVWRLETVKKWSGKKPAITRESAHNAHSVAIFDNTKLLSTLKKFNYTPITETISRMATVFLQQLSLK